jgi:hypothetical protein
MYEPIAQNEYSFHVRLTGEKSKLPYEGTFAVKCLLTQEEMVDIAVRVDRYNSGSKNLPAQYALINRAIAEIEVRLIRDKKTSKPQCPTWWTESDFGRLLVDSNILFEVFAKAMEAESEWQKRLAAKVEAAEKQAQIEKAPSKE